MAGGIGIKPIKLLFIGLNIFFLLAGIVVFAVGVYLVLVGATYSYLSGVNGFLSGAVLLLLCGAVTGVMAIVGIIGAAKQWYPLLIIYTVILSIVIMVEIAAGVLGLVYQHEISQEISQQFIYAIGNYTSSDSDKYDKRVNDFVDNVQETFKCCGVHGPIDWIPYVIIQGNFPESCHCDPSLSSDKGHCFTLKNSVISITVDVYKQGCNETFFGFISGSASAVGGLGITFGIIEVVGVCFGVFLVVLLCPPSRYKIIN